MKIIYLIEAAIAFLKYTGRDTGTRLERDVYQKLLDSNIISFMKADALMFYHIYADLVMLSKSNDLHKSILDMNQHYLEMKLFLQEVEQHPEVMLQRDYMVFRSEKELYGDKKVNFRVHGISKIIHRYLFKECTSNLFPLLVAGAAKMRKKLCEYAQNNLPGGCYWDPTDPEVKKTLAELRPTNDFCESILGLNDCLTTALPNLHQVARSNLVEVKKNKSLKWLNQLPDDQQLKVIDLAVNSRQVVQKEIIEATECRATQRKEKMVQVHIRREALREKKQKMKDQLSQEHLITTSKELFEHITKIESRSITTTKKKTEIRSLLMKQIKIRKTVLEQNIRITFTCSRRQRPLPDVIHELSDFIENNPPEISPFITDPCALLGKQISHKFQLEDTNEFEWYNGEVIDYNHSTKTHTVLYEGEEEPCSFDLTIDIANGDLKVFDIIH